MSASISIRVTLTIDVHVGNWSGEQTFDGLLTQAKREGLAKLRRSIDQSVRYTLVGEPKMISVSSMER